MFRANNKKFSLIYDEVSGEFTALSLTVVLVLTDTCKKYCTQNILTFQAAERMPSFGQIHNFHLFGQKY